MSEWNVAQAIGASKLLVEPWTQPAEKAFGYCWLFHLVGDVHQPLHTVTLVCDRFPEGDRGGNSIRVVQGRNLHSLWDNLLGRGDRMSDVLREVEQLKRNQRLWRVDVDADVDVWIKESRTLAESFVYSPDVLAAVDRPGELITVSMPRAYLEEAGDHAKQRIVAAGLRLAQVLKKALLSGAARP
jgi:hypothetical protein